MRLLLWLVWASHVLVTCAFDSRLSSLLPDGFIAREADSNGFVFTLSGQSETWGFVSGPRHSALLDGPGGIAVDQTGAVYVADTNNHAIRKVFLNGTVVTVCGDGTAGFQDGSFSTARFSSPRGVALASTGLTDVLFIADTGNHVVRALHLSSGQVSTVAGGAGAASFADGSGSVARFHYPWRLIFTTHATWLGAANNALIVLDNYNHRVRLLLNVMDLSGFPTTPASVTVSTVAGGSTAGALDGPLGTNQVRFPTDLVMRPSTNTLYILQHHCVRELTAPGALVVTTVAGDCASAGYADATGSSARFWGPEGITIDGSENIYVADRATALIRRLDMSGGAPVVSTILGSVPQGTVDGPAAIAKFLGPSGIAFLTPGGILSNESYLVIADTDNNVLRLASAPCGAACQNNGTCILPQTCGCLSGFVGATCETPVCSPACGGGTVCTTAVTCECPVGYTGFLCAVPVCENVTCVHGTCDYPNHCSCSNGYTGPNCDIPVCLAACENGAHCVAPDTCNCTVGVWSGTYCTDPICSPACVNGGSCVAPSVCNCTPGWQGATCADPYCSGGCLNGGGCSSPNNCTCADGYNGTSCEVPLCRPPCKTDSGSCIAKDACACTPGWDGKACDQAICDEFCDNGGSCILPNVCQCAAGWSGPACITPVCSPACAGGLKCTAPNTCSSDCFLPCLNGGICISQDNCSCAVTWTGEQCEIPVCSNGCFQGTCVAPDDCQCEEGYTLSNCSAPVCSPPCQNGGSCALPNVCECIGGWEGLHCEVAPCNGLIVGGCGDHGTCTAPGVCTCETGYTGALCVDAVCSLPCANGGSCVAPEVCKCRDGFEGVDCAATAQSSVTFWGENSGWFYLVIVSLVVAAGAVYAYRWRLRQDEAHRKNGGRVHTKRVSHSSDESLSSHSDVAEVSDASELSSGSSQHSLYDEDAVPSALYPQPTPTAMPSALTTHTTYGTPQPSPLAQEAQLAASSPHVLPPVRVPGAGALSPLPASPFMAPPTLPFLNDPPSPWAPPSLGPPAQPPPVLTMQAFPLPQELISPAPAPQVLSSTPVALPTVAQRYAVDSPAEALEAAELVDTDKSPWSFRPE